MGAYRYLNCDKCGEYIHIGKVGGSDFEVDYKTLERFLNKHAEYNGCSISALTDAGGSAYYSKVMRGTEFEGEEL